MTVMDCGCTYNEKGERTKRCQLISKLTDAQIKYYEPNVREVEQEGESMTYAYVTCPKCKEETKVFEPVNGAEKECEHCGSWFELVEITKWKAMEIEP